MLKLLVDVLLLKLSDTWVAQQLASAVSMTPTTAPHLHASHMCTRLRGHCVPFRHALWYPSASV